MAQWIKAIAAKPDDLCLSHCTHRMERTDSQKLSSDFHMCAMVFAHTRTHTPQMLFLKMKYSNSGYLPLSPPSV